MRKNFAALVLALIVFLSASVFAFAADEIDEISVDVALLEDMLTTISTNTSDLIFSNKYNDYGYDVCGSKDSCYIIRLIENLSDPNYKSKYGVIDAESKKVLLAFKYDNIEITPTGNFLATQWRKGPVISNGYNSFAGHRTILFNTDGDEIPLKALPENAFISGVYEDGIASIYKISEEGFVKWGIIDTVSDSLLLEPIGDIAAPEEAYFANLPDLIAIRTDVRHWNLAVHYMERGYTHVPADGKMGAVSRYGQIIIPPQYDELRIPYFGEEKPSLEEYEIEVRINSEKKTIRVKDFITPSAWAVPFIEEAESAGIVPANRIRNYTGPVTRMEIADMVVNIIEAAGGMQIDEFIASNGAELPTDPYGRSTENILRCRALGIVIGVGGDSFNPSGFITRAEMAAVIDKIGDLMGVDKSYGGTTYALPFVDIYDKTEPLLLSWSAQFIEWPSRAGIIGGVGNNKFNPNAILSAEQAIIMCIKTLNVLK